MKERVTYDMAPIYMLPGDTLEVTIKETDLATGKVTEAFKAVEALGHALTIDCIKTFDVDHEHGFKEGIAVLAGEKEKPVEPEPPMANPKKKVWAWPWLRAGWGS